MLFPCSMPRARCDQRRSAGLLTPLPPWLRTGLRHGTGPWFRRLRRGITVLPALGQSNTAIRESSRKPPAGILPQDVRAGCLRRTRLAGRYDCFRAWFKMGRTGVNVKLGGRIPEIPASTPRRSVVWLSADVRLVSSQDAVQAPVPPCGKPGAHGEIGEVGEVSLL